MLDVEIKDKFLGLAQEVDMLARLEWKTDQTGYPLEVLHSLFSTLKILKRQLLQDNIWILLNQHIFCSPFRVLGEEGGILQK